MQFNPLYVGKTAAFAAVISLIQNATNRGFVLFHTGATIGVIQF